METAPINIEDAIKVLLAAGFQHLMRAITTCDPQTIFITLLVGYGVTHFLASWGDKRARAFYLAVTIIAPISAYFADYGPNVAKTWPAIGNNMMRTWGVSIALYVIFGDWVEAKLKKWSGPKSHHFLSTWVCCCLILAQPLPLSQVAEEQLLTPEQRADAASEEDMREDQWVLFQVEAEAAAAAAALDRAMDRAILNSQEAEEERRKAEQREKASRLALQEAIAEALAAKNKLEALKKAAKEMLESQ